MISAYRPSDDMLEVKLDWALAENSEGLFVKVRGGIGGRVVGRGGLSDGVHRLTASFFVGVPCPVFSYISSSELQIPSVL